MKRFLLSKVFLLACFLFVAMIQGVNAQAYSANLSSAQEVPTNASTATGWGRVVLNESTGMISYTVTFSGLSSIIVAAHIHGAAARGANAGVIIPLNHSGTTSGTFSGTAAINATQIVQLKANQTYINLHSAAFGAGEIRGQLSLRRVLDYDGDGKTDFSVLRFPVNQMTYYNRNSSGFSANQSIAWGLANTDFPAPGDYDGDGKDDLCVYRAGATAGQQSFFITLRSSDNTVVFQPWGINGDQAIARDYDGDGKTDVAVFRRGASAGAQTNWYILQSSNQMLRSVAFGLTGNGTNIFDVAIPGDYDGDGKFDIAVFRFGQAPANNYIVLQSSNGLVTQQAWGNFQTDYIAPGDYDGDGKWEIAAARTGATGTSPMVWWIRHSSDGSVRARTFGFTSDLPTQGDYDGDGRTDISVWRPNQDGAGNSAYHILTFGDMYFANNWGLNGDFTVNGFDAR